MRRAERKFSPKNAGENAKTPLPNAYAVWYNKLRTDIPAIAIGDTVKVMVKVVEGKTERLQAFEGVVIAKRNGGIRETFTVRRVSYGIGVERTFPVHSPRLGSITIIRHGKVRRAKLYYLRSLQGRAAKIKEVKRV